MKISKLLKKINLTTRRKVFSLFVGNYRSAYKGQGINFEDLRKYVPGDNVKDIDWNATAKTGTVFVRKYIEQRELTVLFAIDTSSSMGWNYQTNSRLELINTIIILISFAAFRNSDRIGAMFFRKGQIELLPFKKGRGHMLKIISSTRNHFINNIQNKTDHENSFNTLLRNIKKRVICFYITDNIDLNNQNILRLLKAVNKKHELVFLHIDDYSDFIQSVNIPIRIEDMETGELKKIPLDDSVYKKNLLESINFNYVKIQNQFRKFGIGYIRMTPSTDMILEFINFFRSKNRLNLPR